MFTVKRICLMHIIPAGVCIGLITAGTFWDKAVSDALYSRGNFPMLIVSVLGQYLFSAVFIFIAGVLCRQAVISDAHGAKRTAGAAVLGISALIMGIRGLDHVLDTENIGALLPDTEFSLGARLLMLAVFMLSLFFIGLWLSPREYDRALARRLTEVLLYLLAALIVLALLKSSFARPRYRFTLMGTDGIGFLPWYASMGSAKQAEEMYGLTGVQAFASFPSGHSLISMIHVIALPCMAYIFPGLKKRAGTLFVIGACFGFCVMLSRIVLGAHYLSDVGTGGLVALAVSFVFFMAHRVKN